MDNGRTFSRLAFRYQSSMRWLGSVAPPAVLVMAVVAFLIGILVPLYSDEIAVQMTRSRFLVEGGHMVSLLPQCRSTILLSVPVTWYPAALLNALLYFGADRIGLRILGIFLGLAWLLLLWLWAGRHPQELLPKRTFQALALSFNLLGVLPFVLILARSEQILVLSLAAFCLFSLYWRVNPYDGQLLNYLKAFLFLVLTSVFLFSHPKALFFTPFILASAWITFRRASWILRLLVYLIAILAVYQTVQQAEIFTSCPDAPLVLKILGKNTIDFHQLITSKLEFIREAWNNLISAPLHIFDRVPITSQFQSFWLPSIDGNIKPMLVYFGIVTKIAIFLFMGILFVTLTRQIVTQLMHRIFNPSTILAGMLMGGLMIHATIYNQNSWHFYTPGLIIPVMTMLFLTVLPAEFSTQYFSKRSIANMVTLWLIFVFLSMVILLYAETPKLLRIALNGDYIIKNQPLSTPIFVKKQKIDEIHALANECLINTKSVRLILDGVSYFEYKNNKQPINVLYVSNFGFGMDIGNKVLDFLHKIHSDGVLARCDFLQKGLVANASKSGEMCCVSKSAWR